MPASTPTFDSAKTIQEMLAGLTALLAEKKIQLEPEQMDELFQSLPDEFIQKHRVAIADIGAGGKGVIASARKAIGKQVADAAKTILKASEPGIRGGVGIASLLGGIVTGPGEGAVDPAAAEAAKASKLVVELAGLKGQSIPKDPKKFAALMKELLKGEAVTTEEAKTLGRLRRTAGPEILKKLGGVGGVVEGLKEGRLQQDPLAWRAGKSILGLAGKGPTGADIGALESVLGEAGVEKFAGTGAKLARGAKGLLRFRNLFPAAMVGMLLNSRRNTTAARNELAAQPIRTAEQMKADLDLADAVANRRVKLQQDPDVYGDVVRALSGGPSERVTTSSEVEIGNIAQGRGPKEVSQLMDRLLLGLHKMDGAERQSASVGLNEMLMQSAAGGP